MYDAVKRARGLYSLLQDELSKEIFKARLAFDLEPSMTNAVKLLCLNPSIPQDEVEAVQSWRKTLDSIAEDKKKFVLYGTGGMGQDAARAFLCDGIDFYGFCGRRGPGAFPDGLLGKPVISPDYLIQHADEFYVAIFAEEKSFQEITALLEEHSFPQEHIVHCFDYAGRTRQYFEFPSLYRKNTAFVDGGSLDCSDDYFFAEWSGGQYSQITSFEPDPAHYFSCAQRLEKQELQNCRLIQAGLSDRSGTLEFSANGNGGSHILDPGDTTKRVKNVITIQTIALDDVEDVQNVGFIKMDIEGAEFGALHGAERTILRDKPLLAICVYHREGDVLAIMDYLQQLVPEYRFWLRHYGPLYYETVLYASIDNIEGKTSK